MPNKIWAYVANGVLHEIISLDGKVIPGKDIYTPAFAEDMIDVTNISPRPKIGWKYDGVNFSEPPIAPPDLMDYQNAIQDLVDRTAKSKRFNDGISLASYKDSTNPEWASQATIFIAWRDRVWEFAYSELDKVQKGERDHPSVDGFLKEIPSISWE